MLTTRKLLISKSEVETLNKTNNSTVFKSSFQFLRAHLGLREGKLHLLIGTTGGGKSTVVRSIILDFLKYNPTKNILLILSEETKKDLKGDICKTEFMQLKEPNLFIFSEQEENVTTVKDYFVTIENVIKENKIHALVFDNLTTSAIYNDKKPDEQFRISKIIKSLTQKYYLASLVIAHTNSQVSDNSRDLIEPNDIRGSKSIANICEFLYILQRFILSGYFYQTLRINKHRSQAPEEKIFRLNYSKVTNLYDYDMPITFKDFKEANNARDKL